jgi:hypothetical protein
VSPLERADQRRFADLVELDDRAGVPVEILHPLVREAHVVGVTWMQVQQGERRHVDRADHPAEVVACALAADAKQLVPLCRRRREKEPFEPIVALPYGLAVHFEDIPVSDPDILGRLHQQHVAQQAA